MTAATTETPPVMLVDVMAETGATARQLDFWVRSGHLHPTREGSGSGYPYVWPAEELAVAKLMAELVNEWEMTPSGAARVARYEERRYRLAARLVLDPRWSR